MLRDDKPNISYPNHWSFAGAGSMEDGEEPIEAAKRELFEETGYQSNEPLPLMVTTYTMEFKKLFVMRVRKWSSNQ